MKDLIRFFTLCVSGTLAALTGCGGGSQSAITPPPAISVQFTGTIPASLTTGATLQLSALVQNSASDTEVTWSVTCSSANACGAFSVSKTANGASTTYTAPSAVPSGQTVTITATSVADPTKSTYGTITIALPTSVSVTFIQSPPATMAAGASVSIGAVVHNDPSADPQVAWGVSCSGAVLSCGTFTQTLTNSGASIYFNADPGLTQGATVTLTATSVSAPTKSASATLTISGSVSNPILVTMNPLTSTTLPAGYSIQVSARIQNDTSANPLVQWSATCNNADCGTFNPTTTGSNAQATYTAATTAPAGNAVTITASSVADPGKTASATINVYANTSNANLPDGTYVYQLAYSNDGDALSEAGSFIAFGGVIVSGELDRGAYNSDTGIGSLTNSPITGGTYSTTASGNLQLSLHLFDSLLQENEVESLLSTPAPTGSGFLGEVSIAPGVQFSSGTIHLQKATAQPAGGYAFTLNTSGQSLAADAGILNVDSPGHLR